MTPENQQELSLQKQSRKEFITTAIKAGAAASLLSAPANSFAAWLPLQKEYTVQDVIDTILKDMTGTLAADTVDTLKTGSAEQKVTGIVTTMFPTISIIKEAIRLKANFIVAHEPSFYNHLDNKQWVAGSNVVQQKIELLTSHNIAIWRAHDSWHKFMPDGILYGVVKKAGWLGYNPSGNKVFTIPPVNLKALISHLKTKLGIDHVRVIGNPDATCKKIALLPGAWGGVEQVSTLLQDKPDVLIVGELSEWETAEYIRDARLLGQNISLIVLGHAVSEEPGMEWMAEWLKPKLPGLTVTHIASNSPFTWV